MDIPYFVDSDDADSLEMSEKTMIMTEEPEVRVAESINPDNIDIDLYLDDIVLSPQESVIIEEPDEPKLPKSVRRSKAVTVEELENELVECMLENGSVFNILYLLHEHFSKSKTITANEKAVAKGRILGKMRGKVEESRISEFLPILNNFFN